METLDREGRTVQCVMRFPSVCLARALAAAALCLAAFPAQSYFLWEVVSMTNRAWLFGTIHAGKKDWFPLPATIEQASPTHRCSRSKPMSPTF